MNFWIENTGNFPGGDKAVISMTGMESSVLRRVLINGVAIDDDVVIQSGERILVTIELEVLEGVSSGTTGIVKVSTSSEKNAAESTSIDLIFEVRTIHDLQFTLEGEDELITNEKESVEFILYVTNHGNIIETVQVLSSDSLSGWTVNVIED